MVGFLFGGETGVESPQELARKRAQIAAMQGQVAQANPRSFGEGLTAIGRALASRISDRQIGAREEAERERAGSAFSQIAGQLGGGYGGTGGGYSRPSAPPVSAAVPPVTSSPISTPNTAGLPQGIVDAVDRVNPLHPAQNGGLIPAGLVQSESGGNWNALNNEMGAGGVAGHGGRLQFGHARLQDAARAGVIPAGVTPQQFAQMPPEVQSQVENWHFSDIDNSIRSAGLDQLIGQEIGGVPVTLDGLRSVAHLGGTGGMMRFAQSGGEYNPSDSFGTSLMDYLAQGAGGGGTMSQGGAPQGGGMSGGGMNPQIVAQLAELASNPYLPEGQRMIAQQLIQTQLQGMDPMRQLEMQRAQLEIEAMRNPQADNFRMTTPEEAAMYGGQGQMGPDGRFHALPPPPEPQAPTTKNVTMPDGSEVMVQWNPETRNWDAAPIPEGGTSGTGAPADLTEKQAQTTLFSSMQDETRPVLEQIESIWNPANIADAAARSSPIGGNFFTSEQGQIYNTAAAAWAEGALRISTGAAATEPEIQRITRTYFAVAGDTPNVIEFKRSMREMYSRAINASLGYDTSGQGTLVLPDAFAEQYMSENPPPADIAAPASGTPDADGWVTIDGVRVRELP
jgi:hypothetical protein